MTVTTTFALHEREMSALEGDTNMALARSALMINLNMTDGSLSS
jgi:hypothetical protein